MTASCHIFRKTGWIRGRTTKRSRRQWKVTGSRRSRRHIFGAFGAAHEKPADDRRFMIPDRGIIPNPCSIIKDTERIIDPLFWSVLLSVQGSVTEDIFVQKKTGIVQHCLKFLHCDRCLILMVSEIVSDFRVPGMSGYHGLTWKELSIKMQLNNSCIGKGRACRPGKHLFKN